MLAHIRHTHTRYDQLLKETTYTNARKAVEQLCLDILVKWRGDEENGRDQLDEVLREVIVISDSEGEDDNGDGEDEEADSSGVESSDLAVEPSYLPSSAARSLNKHTIPERTNGTQHRPRQPTDAMVQTYNGNTAAPITSQPHRPYMQDTYAAHRARRGFKRYQAALSTRWDEAVNRIRHQRDHPPDGPSVPSPGPVEYNAVHACHEPLHQVQPSSYHPLQLDSSVSVEPPYHGGARNGLHALDFAARISDRAVPTAAHQRSFSGDLSRGASPHRDPRQTQPPQRVLVRSTEGRDLLVPSIEPISPSSESRPIAPVFVRAVSPHQASRHPRGLVGDIWGQSHVHDSPGGPGEEMSLKRRRVVDDEPYDPRDPPQPVLPRRILSDGWQQAPVHYSAAQPVYNAPRFAPERDFHTHYAHAPAKAGGGRIVRAPGSPPGSHSYYENFRAGPPPGSEHAPIVLNDIDEEPNPVTEAFSARDYRGGVYMERRLSPGGAGRAGGDDSRHESKFVDTYYRGPVHTGVPSDQGNMSLIPHPPLPPPPQDMAPLRLGSHSNERSLAQVQQMHVTNPVERRPTDYNQVDHRPDTYAVAPLPTRYREDLEPAPVFVRRVERFEQPRLAEARTQLVEYQNPDPARVYQDPRQAEHMLALYVSLAIKASCSIPVHLLIFILFSIILGRKVYRLIENLTVLRQNTRIPLLDSLGTRPRAMLPRGIRLSLTTNTIIKALRTHPLLYLGGLSVYGAIERKQNNFVAYFW